MVHLLMTAGAVLDEVGQSTVEVGAHAVAHLLRRQPQEVRADTGFEDLVDPGDRVGGDSSVRVRRGGNLPKAEGRASEGDSSAASRGGPR
ncbi:hypothetical protein GCM10010220_57870 [Streptomyces parvulus]|nr:hypothetical protein GCM10010220_57870 [Streptomyces parvulus]